MDNFIENGEKDFKDIFNRFRKRDFSGNTGQAIKNSSFQLTSNLIIKFGSLLFTIIVARLLMPEKMGLYSLALSTIVFFSAFSDFGIGSALLTFVSKSLGKGNPKKAKGYFEKLLKWKKILLISCSLLLISSAYFVANNYYQKPIFYALLVGGLYIPILGLLSFIEHLFKANNNFKVPLIKEIVFQVLRLTLVPLGILILLKTNFSNGIIIAFVLSILTLCYLISLFFFVFIAKRKIDFIKTKSEPLTNEQIKGLKHFLFPLTVTALSGVFFGYIDTLMLGHFVSSEYLAYYGSAFSLVGSAIAIIGFTATALFPLFSKLEGKSLEILFRKTRNITFIISLLSAIITYFVAYYVVRIAYGQDYLFSVPILKILSIIVFLIPLSGIYDNYLLSQKKTNYIAKILIISTMINIVLNYFGINYGLNHGFFWQEGSMSQAVLGACFATITSRIFYLLGIIYLKNKYKAQQSKSF
jgi:O-antigen/teichoic acid export membrane protein